MAYIGNFDATTVEPATEYGALPSGDYAVIITDSEMANTKTGGQMLKLTLEVIEGEHKGRYLWSRLNLINANPKAVEIAQRELSSICHATGVMRLTDSTELHNKPMTVKAVYVPPKGEYKESNDIKAWKPYSATSAPSPASAFKAPPTAQAAARQAPTPVQRTASPAPAPAPAPTAPWKKTPAAPVSESAGEDIPF